MDKVLLRPGITTQEFERLTGCKVKRTKRSNHCSLRVRGRSYFHSENRAISEGLSWLDQYRGIKVTVKPEDQCGKIYYVVRLITPLEGKNLNHVECLSEQGYE